MKKINLLFASLAFLFISCSKNNPVEPFMQSDSELRANIIGEWSNQYSTIHYYADGTFQNSVYGPSSNNKTIEAVINGNYNIEDGILNYIVSDWEILDDSVKQIPFSISYPKYKLQMTRDLMYVYPLDILTRIGNEGSDIWGDWSSSEWTISYNPQRQNPFIIGDLLWRYNFNQDLMTVTYGTSFPANSDSIFHYTTEVLEYNPPNLSWGLNYEKTIEFNNNKLYMFFKLINQPIPLKKIN